MSMVSIRPRNRVRRERSTAIFAAFARAILSVAGSVSASGIVAADPETIVDRLASPVRGAWRRSTINDVAAQLARDGGVPIAIDRRIDFTRTIDLDGEARSLAAVLDELADRVGGAAVVHGACVRIAPLDAASGAIASGTSRGRRLAAVPKTVRDALAIEAPLVVEAGERPREIVERLLAGAVLEADGLDLIPDDHLPAATYPPMPLVDRLDTVLAHYDLALAADREGGTGSVEVEAIRDAGHRGGDPPKLASLAEGRPVRPPVPIDRFTLRTDAALDELLTALAKQFGLRLAVDLESLARKGVAAKEIVKLSVRDVSRDALLDAITRPLGLEWTIDGDRLVVR